MWTEARIVELKQYREEGKTGSEIALIFGCTRNAIIGKCNRLGLASPRRHGQHGALVANRNRREKPPTTKWLRPSKRKPALYQFAPETVEPLKVKYLDLTFGQCRFVLDETDDDCLPLSCGHPTHPGSSWCPHHHARFLVRR